MHPCTSSQPPKQSLLCACVRRSRPAEQAGWRPIAAECGASLSPASQCTLQPTNPLPLPAFMPLPVLPVSLTLHFLARPMPCMPYPRPLPFSAHPQCPAGPPCSSTQRPLTCIACTHTLLHHLHSRTALHSHSAHTWEPAATPRCKAPHPASCRMRVQQATICRAAAESWLPAGLPHCGCCGSTVPRRRRKSARRCNWVMRCYCSAAGNAAARARQPGAQPRPAKARIAAAGSWALLR